MKRRLFHLTIKAKRSREQAKNLPPKVSARGSSTGNFTGNFAVAGKFVHPAGKFANC